MLFRYRKHESGTRKRWILPKGRRMRERTRRSDLFAVVSVGTTSSGKSTRKRCSCSRSISSLANSLVTRLRSERRNGLLLRFSESSSTLRRLWICRENSLKSTKEKEKGTDTSTRRLLNAYWF